MTVPEHRGPAVAAVLLAAIFSLSLRPAIDSDYFWHVANGSHLADGLLFAGGDRYSWTAAGHPWVAHEWLTEALMGTVDATFGPFGNSLLIAVVVALGFGLVALRLRRRQVGWTVTLTTAALAFAASLVSAGVRPQMLEIVYLGLTLLLLDEWWRLDRHRYLLALAFLGWLWAQTHGSFLILPAVLGIAAVAAAIRRQPSWPRLAAAAVGGAVLPLLNPWGVRLYEFAVQSMTSATTLELVQEWRPPNLLATSFLPFTAELALLVAGGIAFLVLRRRERRRGDDALGAAPIADLLLTVAFLVLALRSGRNVMLFGVAAAPMIAGAIGRLKSVAQERGFRIPAVARFPGISTAADDRTRRVRRLIDLSAAAVTAVVVIAGGVLRVTPDRQAVALAEQYPVHALPALEAAVTTAPGIRLFNEYTWGGFLIERAPTIPVFIDGRSEVYGDDQLARYAAIARLAPGWSNALGNLGVGLALIRSGSPLEGALVTAGWRAIERDTVAVLYARP